MRLHRCEAATATRLHRVHSQATSTLRLHRVWLIGFVRGNHCSSVILTRGRSVRILGAVQRRAGCVGVHHIPPSHIIRCFILSRLILVLLIGVNDEGDDDADGDEEEQCEQSP